MGRYISYLKRDFFTGVIPSAGNMSRQVKNIKESFICGKGFG
jgi:hypothetical protein